MNKIKPSDLQSQAEQLKQSGGMPSLEDVLQAVAETRQKYASKILEARKAKHPAETLR